MDNKAIRHGDVLFIPVKAVDGEFAEVSRDPKLGIVLAYGETTGHAHHLTDPGARLFEPKGTCSFRLGDDSPLAIDVAGGGPPRVLEVAADTVLLHHDHGVGTPDGVTELATPISAGRYVVVRQRERSFGEIKGYRRVAD